MRRILPILIFSVIQHASAQHTSTHRSVAVQSSSVVTFNSAQNIWDEKEAFVNGYSRVLKSGKFTFVNEGLQPVCQPVFDGARNFSGHLAAVSQNDKWGFLTEKGRLAVPCKFDLVYDFSLGFTVGYANRDWFSIDANTYEIKPLGIDICYGISNGKFVIAKNGRKGVIENDGSHVTMTESISNLSAAAERINPSANNNLAGDCPDNLTFEYGNFTNWRCYTGTVDSIGTTNVITVSLSGPVANRHRIISRTTPSAIDFFGLFPVNPPDGSNYAVKLGNTNIGAQAERIAYTIHVPQNDSNFSIRYDYAVVFQDPGHTSWSQPRFTAKLFDSAANSYVNCASFEYISTSNLPGFARSTVDTTVIYKPWSTVFISLSAFAGKTMYLEFTTADCVRRGHWGYAYLDVENTCGKPLTAQYDCSFPHVTTLDAPPGFQTYNWWNQNFSSVLATGQHAVLNPGPSPNSNLWVEMIPYNTFGCRDTLRVGLTGSFTPSFSSSETNASCAPHTITFHNNNLPASSVIWNFGDGSTGSGDTVSHTYQTAGTYIVTMTVSLPAGCSGTATDTIVINQPTVAMSYTGGQFCSSRNVSFALSSNGATSYHVDFGDGTSQNTSAATINHTYSSPGTYLPVITATYSGGCTISLTGNDTIRIENLIPEFVYTIQQNCNATTVTFNSQSQSYFGITGYSWNFADGTTAAGSTVTHTFTRPTTYLVKLKITGASGCIDSVVHPVTISIIRPPSISIGSVSSVCENDSVTFISNISTTDSISGLYWTIDNVPVSGGNNLTYMFTQSGVHTATLIGTTLHGCADTAIRQITVKPLPSFQQPADQTLCNGAATNPIVFAGQLPGTTYTWVNDNPTVGLAASGTGNIASFSAINNGIITAYANITVTAASQGCYVTAPAFTIAVNPTPSSITPPNQTLCNRGYTDPVIFNSFAGNAITSYTYTWTNDLPAIGLPASGTGNIVSFMAVNDGSSPVTATVTITPASNGCTGVPVNFTITVNPTPNLFPPLNQQICNGALSNAIIFTGNTVADLINWTNNNPGIGLPSSGIGDIRPFNATCSGNTPVTAQIQVYPTLSGCSGPIVNFTITVNPIPDIAPLSDVAVCNGAIVSPVNFSGSVAGTVYNWTNSNTGIGLAASGTGVIPSFTASNTSADPESSSINVTTSANGCAGPSQNFTVTINPAVVIDSIADNSVCNGKLIDTISISGLSNGTTYSWTNDNTGIGLGASGTGDILPFTATNNSNQVAVANITVLGSSNYNCPSASRTFKILINPTPQIVAGNDVTVCRGSQAQLSASGGATYHWSPASGLNCVSCSNPLANTSGDITYVVEGSSAAGCVNRDSVTVRVIQPFNMLVSPNDSTCTGKSVRLNAMNADHYIWSPSAGLDNPNTANPVATPSGDIRYQVIGYDAHNCFTDTGYVSIRVFGAPSVNAGPDVEAASGSTIVLQGTSQNGPVSSWTWTPPRNLSCTDCPNPTMTVSGNMSYVLTVENKYGCKASDTMNVVTFCKNAQVFIPNAFTPDGDGINDILMVRGTGITVRYFRIFNRWGNLVFEREGFSPNDPKYGWDGKVKGVKATPDVFVFIAEVVCDNGTPYFYKGNVTILQ